MKLAIMQPYFFPYIGYFQLVAAVDRFVFYDDVNYMVGGWINRNRLILSGQVGWLTLPLRGASPHRRINEVEAQLDPTRRRKLLSSVAQSYRKAPHFEQVHALFAGIVQSDDPSLSALARQSVVAVARYLGFSTEFVVSSGRYGNEFLRGTERVLDICRREGATEYHNLPGGKSLYSAAAFADAGIELRFVEPNLSEYRQFDLAFTPGLSIIDVLMFNDRAKSRRLLIGGEFQ